MFCVCTLGLASDLPQELQFISSHDKWTHFTIFMVETFLFISMFPKHTTYIGVSRGEAVDLDYDRGLKQVYTRVNKYALTFVVCVLCASIGSEFLQYVATQGARNLDPFDMVVNIMGSGLGMGLFHLLS